MQENQRLYAGVVRNGPTMVPVPLIQTIVVIMIDKDARLSVRLTLEAKQNLDTYCRFTGQKPAEVVRAGIAQIMAPYFSQIMSAPREIVQPTSNRLEDDSERKAYTQAFIGNVKNCKFPPRIAKSIKEQWEAIKESQIPAEILAEAYGDYVTAEKSAGREHCHPSSWITNHGWLNENDTGGGPIYDTDR